MGNCLHSSKDPEEQFESLFNTNLGTKKLNDSVPDLSADIETVMTVPSKCDVPQIRHAGDLSVHDMSVPNESENRGMLDTQKVPYVQNTITQKQAGVLAQNGTHGKVNPAWLKYINPRPTGDVQMDTETGSIFAENWDPALFDQRGSPSVFKSLRYRNESINSRSRFHDCRPSVDRRKASYTGIWNPWSSNESLNDRPKRSDKPPLVSSSILGFSQLRTDVSDSMEWFRNGELESPQPNVHNFLIKGKQKPIVQSSGLNENNADFEKSPSSTGVNRSGGTDYREGWLRYTMFLHQEKADAINFYATIRKAKHTFLSLEARTGCEIRLSKRLFVHRGKYVRTVVIDGPSRKHILRCYSSLPKLLTEMIILECERPSISEHRSSTKLSGPDAGIGNYSSFVPRPVLV